MPALARKDGERALWTLSLPREGMALPFWEISSFAGWSIWRGPADGDGRSMLAPNEEDRRALALREIDFRNLIFNSHLGVGESVITGTEQRERQKLTDHVPLHALVGYCLWQQNDQRILNLLYYTHGISYLRFLGTKICGRETPVGEPHTLAVAKQPDRWAIVLSWDQADYGPENFSAELAA